MDYIRRTYAVPAKRGALVRPKVGPAKGQLGRVLRALDSGRLTVRDNGPQRLQVWWGVYHPTDLHYVTTDKQRGSDGESVQDAQVQQDAERWGQQFRCGCFLGFPTKRAIPKHCPQHLRDRQGSPLPLAAEMPIDLLAANPSACELGAARAAIQKARNIADGASACNAQGLQHQAGMRRACNIIEDALQQRGDSRGGEVDRG